MAEKIFEERIVPSTTALMRKTYTSSPETIKQIEIPFCSSCGQRLLLAQVFLCNCGLTSCESCLIYCDGRVMCGVCIQEKLPLSKDAFLVLDGARNEITSFSTLREVTSLQKAQIKTAFYELERRGYIESSGFSIFSKWSVTSRGHAAAAVYSRLYGEDGDFAAVRERLKELREKLNGRKHEVESRPESRS